MREKRLPTRDKSLQLKSESLLVMCSCMKSDYPPLRISINLSKFSFFMARSVVCVRAMQVAVRFPSPPSIRAISPKNCPARKVALTSSSFVPMLLRCLDGVLVPPQFASTYNLLFEFANDSTYILDAGILIVVQKVVHTSIDYCSRVGPFLLCSGLLVKMEPSLFPAFSSPNHSSPMSSIMRIPCNGEALPSMGLLMSYSLLSPLVLLFPFTFGS